jgi:hypothetical protein
MFPALNTGAHPVLVAASPYPRQIQNLGAPFGFVEAGASDFFVPRGYVHVIANCRGTGGSGGTFGFHGTTCGAESSSSTPCGMLVGRSELAAAARSRGSSGLSRMRLAECAAAFAPHVPAFQRLTNSKHVRAVMLGEFGLTWPWESLHIEALAWFDHLLKNRDTGILEGPRFRYVLPAQANGVWPTLGRRRHHTQDTPFAVRRGTRPERRRQRFTDHDDPRRWAQPTTCQPDGPPSSLCWDSEPLADDLDVVCDIDLELDAVSTASDTGWIVLLPDVDPAGAVTDVTQGYLRVGLRKVDESASRPGAPILPCRAFEPVAIGEVVRYRIPLVPNARRFRTRVRLHLTSDDQDPKTPAMLEFRHASVGTSCLSTIKSSSRLHLPILTDDR